MLFQSFNQMAQASLPVLLAATSLGMSVAVKHEPVRLGDDCTKRNATVRLYPQNPSGYPRYGYLDNDEDVRPYDALNMPPNVCLSGDYPLSRNLEIVNTHVCSDGSTAFWSIFQNRRCTGAPQSSKLASTFIWEAWPMVPSHYWSLVFRCGGTLYSPVPNDVKHIDAVPPVGPIKGVIQQGGLHTCSRQDASGVYVNQKQTVAVDTCHKTRDYGLRIYGAATCKNGSRAQWARFSDDKCKTPMSEDPLVDINDSDLGLCKPTGNWVVPRPPHVGIPNTWKMNSMAFYCDGVQDPEDDAPKAQPAVMSTDACYGGPVTPHTPPTFRYPEADKCVDYYGSQPKIYENAICANGTSAILAQYKYHGCSGTPDCFAEIGEDKLDKCLTIDNFQSFSFMCTGVIQRPVAPPVRWQPDVDRGRERAAMGIMIAGIVMLSVGVLLLVGIVLRAVFKDEKRRAKFKSIFTLRRREGTIVLI